MKWFWSVGGETTNAKGVAVGAPNVSEIPGWLSQAEADELHRLAAGRVCLEAGSYCGRSSVAIGTAAKRLECIDPFDGRGTPNPRDTLPHFREVMNRFRLFDRVSYLQGTIEDFAHVTAVKSFDLIFLDTDHTAAAISRDLSHLAPYMSRRGVVAVHDHGNGMFPEVAPACESFFHGAPDRVVDTLAVYLLDGPPAGRLLNVVTPVSRPQNIAHLSATLNDLRAALPGWVVRWYVSLDRKFDHFDAVGLTADLPAYSLTRQSPGGVFGNSGRNDALNAIRDGWVCFLDDDNTFHPEFAPGLVKSIAAHPSATGFVFPQINDDGSTRVEAHAWMTNRGIDTAMFVFRRSAIGKHRWPLGEYSADVAFFNAVARGERPLQASSGKVSYNTLRMK